MEAETIAGTARTAAAILNAVRVGSVQDAGVEFMITDVKFPGVDGVLGQSWLIRHDYLLDLRNRRLVMDAAVPAEGVRTPLRSADGRPQVFHAALRVVHDQRLVPRPEEA